MELCRGTHIELYRGMHRDLDKGDAQRAKQGGRTWIWLDRGLHRELNSGMYMYMCRSTHRELET